MNISEANDVAVLLRLLGTAEPVTTTGTAEATFTGDRVVEACTRLQKRVQLALQAGPQIDEDQVREMVRLIDGELLDNFADGA